MPITYKHVKTGRLVRVLTPDERASGVNQEFYDRTRRRQIQLIAKMDGSAKWERTPDAPLVGPGANRQPVDATNGVPAETEPDEPDQSAAKPAAGPKFTRIVAKS